VHTKEITPVTLTDSSLSKLLAAVQAGDITDTVRTSLAWVLQELIEAELTATIGAAPHERTDNRGAQRNGHRPKLLTTQAGDIEVQIPKLRAGSFFPSILERRRRIDRALHAVVMEAWVHGVSTRKVDDLVKALGPALASPSRRSAGSARSSTRISRRSGRGHSSASSRTCSPTPPTSRPASAAVSSPAPWSSPRE
jgi:transposase-like protein